jgi:hypothetical protein
MAEIIRLWPNLMRSKLCPVCDKNKGLKPVCDDCARLIYNMAPDMRIFYHRMIERKETLAHMRILPIESMTIVTLTPFDPPPRST